MVRPLDTNAVLKRLARTFGLAFMISGGLLCGVAASGALSGQPDATLDAAIYAAFFCLGGILFFWSRKP